MTYVPTVEKARSTTKTFCGSRWLTTTPDQARSTNSANEYIHKQLFQITVNTYTVIYYPYIQIFSPELWRNLCFLDGGIFSFWGTVIYYCSFVSVVKHYDNFPRKWRNKICSFFHLRLNIWLFNKIIKYWLGNFTIEEVSLVFFCVPEEAFVYLIHAYLFHWWKKYRY
jgi:hypothetical protein